MALERAKKAVRSDPGGQQLSRKTRAKAGLFTRCLSPARICAHGRLAEGMRFELTVRFDTVRRFSKPLPSATRPPLRRERTTYPGNPGHSVCPTVFKETPPPGQTR